MERRNKPKVKGVDVIRAFWSGAKHYKLSLGLFVGAYFLANILELFPALLYKQFFDSLGQESGRSAIASTLASIVIMILGLNVSKWALYRFGALSGNYFESKVMALLRESSFNYVIQHSYSFFSNNFTGALVQKIGRFARAFERLTDTLVYSMLPLVVGFVGSIYVVWRQEPRLAVILLGWAVIMVVVIVVYSSWKVKFDVASAAADTRTGARLADSMTNHNSISSFAAVGYESKAFKGVVDEQQALTLKSWNVSEFMNAFQGIMMVAIEFLTFYYAIKFWQLGQITIGTFVLIQVYIIGLAQKLWGLNNIVRSVYESFADSKEMVEILKHPHEVSDTSQAKSLVVSHGEIRFKDVSFEFGNSRNVLSEINLTVNPGERLALIGPSGSGKSTMVKLLQRMYNLVHGEITIDGQDIQQVTQDSLRQNISLVPQDPVLFHRTLMENIRYGRLDATDEEVIEAAKLAHCDEFIDTLPDKYNTFVGERGIKLSGGERQRVAIARAILKNAPILILDEATSSLDSHSESLIQDALDKLMKGKTTIVIAHRLSTIRKMDRIIVLEKGKIIEEGSHDDLLSKKQSLYKNLWSLQAGGFLHE